MRAVGLVALVAVVCGVCGVRGVPVAVEGGKPAAVSTVVVKAHGVPAPPAVVGATNATANATTNAITNATTNATMAAAVGGDKPAFVPPVLSDKRVMVVAVCSAPSHFEQREAIRGSWGKLAKSLRGVDVVFHIGQLKDDGSRAELERRLAAESNKFQDVVRLDSFIEAYSNLTRKTLAMARWSSQNRYEVMLKVDDDSFVLLDTLYYDVVAYEWDRASLYWGRFWGNDDRPVSRVEGSKFFVSRAEYAPDTFPNYADGPCYALGKNVLQYLDSHADSLPLYSLEDAAVGIWLNSAGGLDWRDVFGDGFMYKRECPEGNGYYFVNPVTAQEMTLLWGKYSNHRDLCSDNYQLDVCKSPDKGCLCSPSDHPCWDLSAPQALL